MHPTVSLYLFTYRKYLLRPKRFYAAFEELLAVNGGKQVKDDPRTDRNSDTCPHSSNAPGERSSGGSSSSGGPNKGEERSPTQGGGAPRTECSPPAKRDTSSGESSGRSSSSGRESGGSSDSKPSNPGGVNKGEERSPTQGGGAPRTECSPPSKRDSSGGGGSFDRGERDRDSDRDSDSSGGGGSGYRPSAQSQPVPKPSAQHGQGNGLSQKPNPAVPALPEEKKGLGEKIREWFNGKREEGVGNIKERFNRGLKGGVDARRDGLAGQGNIRPLIKSVSSDGTWVNNGDAKFTAQKKATLSGLQELTGKDWRESNWDKKRDPKTLQVGEIVDMGKRTSMPTGAPLINNNKEAEYLYNNGNGTKAWLGDDVYKALREKNAQKENKIQSGNTPLAEGNYRITLSGKNLLFGKNSIYDKNGMFFMGNTQIKYKISTGTEFCVVDFTASDGDGFWDIYDFRNNSPKADGIGPNLERNGSFPYAFYPRTWSISFPVPNNKKW